MRKITFFLLIGILVNTLNFDIYAEMSSNDTKVARKMWLEGFDNYDKAKKDSETGNYKESLQEFKDALKLFEKIKKLYPDWNKALIDYRINVCRSKIVEVKSDMQKNQLQGSQMELDVENLKLKKRVKELEKQLKETRNQLDITFASLDVARRESARNDKVIKQVNDLLREKINLTNKCAMLRSQITELKKQKSAPAPMPEKEEELKQALLQLDTIKKDRDELLSTIDFQKKKFKKIIEERNELSLKLQSFENADNNDKQRQTDLEDEIKNMKQVTLKLQKEKDDILVQMDKLRKKQADKEIMIEQLKMELEKSRNSTPSSENATLDKLTKDKELLMVSLENANEKISSQNKDIKTLKAKIALAENKVTTLGNTLAAIDSKRTGLESDMNILTKKLADYEKVIKEQKKRLRNQSINYKNLQKDFELYSKTVRTTDGDAEESSSLVQKLASSEKEKEELKSELETVNSDYAKIQEQVQNLQKQLKSAHAEVKELENGAAALNTYANNDELDALKEKNTKLTVALDSLKISNSELVTKVNSLNDKVEELNKDIAQKQVLLDKAQNLCELKLKESAAKIPPSPKESQEYMALLNENDQLKAFAQEQKNTIAENRQKLNSMQAELKKKDAEIDLLKKNSEKSQNIQDNPQFVQLMKEKTEIENSIAGIKSKNNELKELVQKCKTELSEKDQIIEKLQNAVDHPDPINVKDSPAYTALLGKNKVLTRLLDDQKETILQIRSQITILKKEIEEKNIRLSELKHIADTNKKYKVEDDPKYKELMEQKQQLQLALDAKNSEIKNIKETVDKLKHIADTNKKYNIEDDPKYKELMEQKQQLQLALDAKNSEIKNIKETVNDLKNVADSNKEYNIEDDPKYKELMEQQKQLQLALDAKNSEIKNIKETVNELKNELKSRETQIASLKDSSSANSDIKNTPEYIALMNENDQLQTMLNDKSKSIESLKKSVGDLESENATLVNLKHSYEAEKERKQSEEAENEKAHEEIWKLIEAAAEAEKNGKTDAATWYYETILEQDHENPTALSKLGLMKASIGNFSDAEPLLKKAVEKDPKNLEALLALTFCYISNKKYYKALSMAALANTVNSNNATVHRYMGIICSYLGWYDVAETEFRKAFRINPKSGETAYNATVNLIKADISKIKIAKQWYDKAIELGIEKDLVLEKLFQKKLKEFADSDKKKHSKLRGTHSSKKMSKSK